MKTKGFVLILLLLPTLAYAEPAMKFEAETHDFGDVTQGVRLQYAFQFTNTGTDVLTVLRADAS